MALLTTRLFDLIYCMHESQLESGTAEVFGAELQAGVTIKVEAQKIAVFTWLGCKVHVEGKPGVIYTADETPMTSYLNIHTILNNQRKEALSSGKRGPHCIILGPTDSGKSTLTKCLCNWAVRSGWEPAMVDLGESLKLKISPTLLLMILTLSSHTSDIGQGSITVPGCIAATPIELPVDIEEGYTVEMPLVFFYGHASASDNPELYNFLVDRLAAVLEKRAESNPKASASGLIINTMGWVDGLGYELASHAISSMKSDVVLVMEQDRLFTKVTNDFKSRPEVSVVKLAKSGGVVKREKDERRGARDRRIKEYFFGTQGNPLVPVTSVAKADQLTVFRVGGGPRAPTSTLPIGAMSAADPLKITHLPPTAELMQSLVAVSYANTPDQILSSNVAGFLLIKEVDSARGNVTFMAPGPGSLPGRYLINGSLRCTLD